MLGPTARLSTDVATFELSSASVGYGRSEDAPGDQQPDDRYPGRDHSGHQPAGPQPPGVDDPPVVADLAGS